MGGHQFVALANTLWGGLGGWTDQFVALANTLQGLLGGQTASSFPTFVLVSTFPLHAPLHSLLPLTVVTISLYNKENKSKVSYYMPTS